MQIPPKRYKSVWKVWIVLILSQPCPHSWALLGSCTFLLKLGVFPEASWNKCCMNWRCLASSSRSAPAVPCSRLSPAHPVWQHHTLLLPGCQQPCEGLAVWHQMSPSSCSQWGWTGVMFFLRCLCLLRKLRSADIYSLSACEGAITETKGCSVILSGCCTTCCPRVPVGSCRFGWAIAGLLFLPISVARKGNISVTRAEKLIQILG